LDELKSIIHACKVKLSILAVKEVKHKHKLDIDMAVSVLDTVTRVLLRYPKLKPRYFQRPSVTEMSAFCASTVGFEAHAEWHNNQLRQGLRLENYLLLLLLFDTVLDRYMLSSHAGIVSKWQSIRDSSYLTLKIIGEIPSGSSQTGRQTEVG